MSQPLDCRRENVVTGPPATRPIRAGRSGTAFGPGPEIQGEIDFSISPRSAWRARKQSLPRSGVGAVLSQAGEGHSFTPGTDYRLAPKAPCAIL